MKNLVTKGVETNAAHSQAFARNPLKPLIEQMAARLAQEPGVEQIILFGSQATNEAGPDSDIDLLLVKRTRDSFITRCAAAKKNVRDLSGFIPFSPIVLTPEELQKRLDRGDHFIEQIVERGVRLL